MCADASLQRHGANSARIRRRIERGVFIKTLPARGELYRKGLIDGNDS